MSVSFDLTVDTKGDNMEEINESAQKIFIKNIGPCLATEEQDVRLFLFRSLSHSLLTTPFFFLNFIFLSQKSAMYLRSENILL